MTLNQQIQTSALVALVLGVLGLIGNLITYLSLRRAAQRQRLIASKFSARPRQAKVRSHSPADQEVHEIQEISRQLYCLLDDQRTLHNKVHERLDILQRRCESSQNISLNILQEVKKLVSR